MLEQNISLYHGAENSADDSLYVSLIDVLKRELSVYVELKNFLIEEKELLMSLPSLNLINENNIRKENIILKSRILEEVRVNIIKKIARNFDRDEAGMKLNDLAHYASSKRGESLEQVKNDLAHIAREITALNDENNQILNIYNNNINKSLELLLSLDDPSGTYLNDGSLTNRQKNGRFVTVEG